MMTVKNGVRVWDDEYEREHFSPEEIAESKLRFAAAGKLIEARQEKTEARGTQPIVHEAVFAGGLEMFNELTIAAIREGDEMLASGTGERYASVNALFEDLDN